MFISKTRQDIIGAIEDNKIIAILRGIPSDRLCDTVAALYDGGIRLVEVTYSADGSRSDCDTAADIRMLAERFDGKMYIGAGTVLTEHQVTLTKNAGGTFIISPDANPAVIKKTVDEGMVSIPGALSPTEITAADRAGADFVKLFPVVSLGTEYIKAIRAPLCHIKMLAVGGIDSENMTDFLKAGVCGVGIGSNITDKRMIANGDFDGIRRLCEQYTTVINNG